MQSDLSGLLEYTASHKDGKFNFYQSRMYFIQKQYAEDSIRTPAKRELEDEINWLEDAARRHRHPQLYLAAATLAELYAGSYSLISKGEDKRPGYEWALKIYEGYAASFLNDPTPLFKAAQICIGVPQMRDRERAQRYLDRVRRIAPLSVEHRQELDRLEEARKPPPAKAPRSSTPKPVPTLPASFNYEKLIWPPDERVRCRAIYRNAKKTKDMDLMRRALEHLYRVAVIDIVQTYIAYTTNEHNEERLENNFKSNIRKLLALNFSENGRLKPYPKDKPFLSDNDYKFFELAWGPSTKTCDPIKEIGMREVAR